MRKYTIETSAVGPGKWGLKRRESKSIADRRLRNGETELSSIWARKVKEPAWEETIGLRSPGSTLATRGGLPLSYLAHSARPSRQTWPLSSAVPLGHWIPPTGPERLIATAAARRHHSHPRRGRNKSPDASDAYISRPWAMLYVQYPPRVRWKAWDEDSKSQNAVLLGGGTFRTLMSLRSGGRSFPACSAAVPRCGETARRREAQRPRRVCAGALKEAQHDCTFGGVARRTALPEVSLSQPRVELLPGDVRLLVSGWGGVDVGGPGGEKLLPLGLRGPARVWRGG